jgi:hypothetical protein
MSRVAPSSPSTPTHQFVSGAWNNPAVACILRPVSSLCNLICGPRHKQYVAWTLSQICLYFGPADRSTLDDFVLIREGLRFFLHIVI